MPFSFRILVCLYSNSNFLLKNAEGMIQYCCWSWCVDSSFTAVQKIFIQGKFLSKKIKIIGNFVSYNFQEYKMLIQQLILKKWQKQRNSKFYRISNFKSSAEKSFLKKILGNLISYNILMQHCILLNTLYSNSQK